MRKECPEVGWGKWQIIDTGNPSVFAHRCEWQGRAVMAVHNLGREACTVTLNLKNEEAEHLIDLLGDQQYQRIEDTSHDVQLEGYGYRWFRIGGQHL
jgi:maltose alpha-D-glucosyltransferase/alpha-amylase